ncbi:hypothetical protein CISIN_1g038836mg, partial [Citrus sinensis]
MSGEESSILSTLLFCLLIYLFPTETEAREVLQQTRSSSCGDIKNISYPFRLKGDPSGCGYPEFELSCQSNQTILELFNSAKYYVKRISYDESTISVADVNLANAFIRVPCLSGGNQSNVYVNYHGSYVSDFSESCSFVSMVPIHNGNEENPSYETLRELLETGFDLRWSVGCRNCYAAGRGCIIFAECHIAEVVFGKFICYQELLTRSLLVQQFYFVFLIHKYRTTLKTVDSIEKFLRNQQSWMPKRYSYPKMIAMTNHFTYKLGQGGFGSVYKGQLHTGRLIAIKLLENSKFSAEQFINEVSTIGKIHHVNVVQLFGFYSEGSKRALIYENIFSKESKGQTF